MSTHAHIAIPTPTGDWLQVYCHYDGYPDHMLPALEHYTPEQILAAREIRFMDAATLEAFEKPRAPQLYSRPTLPEGIAHLYAWNAEAGAFEHIRAA